MQRSIALVIVLVLSLSACVTGSKPTVEQRRSEIKKMRFDTVQEIEKFQTDIRQRIANAAWLCRVQ